MMIDFLYLIPNNMQHIFDKISEGKNDYTNLMICVKSKVFIIKNVSISALEEELNDKGFLEKVDVQFPKINGEYALFGSFGSYVSYLDSFSRLLPGLDRCFDKYGDY